jgi:hypothetical protein
MPTPHEAFNALVYQTLEAAAALLEAGRPAEALHTIKNLAEMEITARQREQYIALRRQIEAQLVTDSWVTLQLAHPEPLNFGLLTDAVIPYLQALHRLHEVVARLQGKSPSWDPEIRQLSHHSPFSITFGFWHPEIIQAILEVVAEERRGPAQRIQAGESPLVQPLLTRVSATYKLLERVGPAGTTEQQKNALANQILPDIDLLASSPVEAQVIGVSVRRDETPPPTPPPAPEPEAARRAATTKPPLPEEPATEPPTPSTSRPRDVGSAPPPTHPRYPPSRRITRPAPKPFSQEGQEEEESSEGGE